MLVAALWSTPEAWAQPTPGEEPASPETVEEEPAAAASEPKPDPSAPDPERLEEAKRLFKEGNALRTAGDCQRAVVKYEASRMIVSAVPNTKNAAVCLRDLDRIDEALALYEELLTRFNEELSASDRQIVANETNALRARVGAVDVVANIDGMLVIDGRARGELPLSLPVRVMPGTHKIVVLAQGYKSFEKSVTVEARQTVAVDATLVPLADAGEVRLDDPALDGASVFVDGAPLGVVPWQGRLEPGTHRFYVRRGDEGSAPQALDVVKGQTVTAKATLSPLGTDLRIEARPATATLRIDGVAVGSGRWQGRLPLGSYEISAEEEGYLASKKRLTVEPRTDRATLDLAVDEDHPRWDVPIPGGPWVEVLGGGLIAPSFNGQFEGAECDLFEDCTGDPFAAGMIVMGRGGYEFPMGLSIMAGGGYMLMKRSVTAPIDDTGDIFQTDDITLSGPFGVVGLRQRFVFADMFETRLSYSFGVIGLGAKSDVVIEDPTQGSFEDHSESGGVNIFLMPEIQFGMRFGGFGVALGFATPLFLLKDPQTSGGGLYKNFFAFLPSASASYLF